MATASRKTTAKRATKGRGRSAPRAAAETEARARATARPTPQSLFAPLTDLGKALDDLNLSSMAATIAEGRRKDLNALVAANKKSYEGLQAVITRQTAMLKSAISDWQSLAQGMQGVSMRDGVPGIGQVDEVVRQTFSMALQNIRELGELAARSQAEAYDIVRRRIMENVEEVNALLKRGR